MSDKSFSHVCAGCRTPSLINLGGRSGLTVLILAASTIAGGFLSSVPLRSMLRDGSAQNLGTAGFLLWVPGGMLLGFFVGYMYLRHSLQKKARVCPSCHSERLLPVSSPEGLRLMKDLGFTES